MSDVIRPEAGSWADMMTRILELKKQSNENVPGQHVVSKTLLKQFTDQNGMLHEISVRHVGARTRVKGPGGAGKVTNFVPVASASAEKLWQEVENELPRVLKLCDGDEVHNDTDAVDLVRDAIALHFIRGRQTPVVHERVYRQSREETKRSVWLRPDFEQEFRRRHHGLYPAGPEAREMLFDELACEHDENFHSGLMFRESIERLFDRVRVWLSNHHIEVIHPASGTFLIGDTPALTIDREGRLGPVSGVALGDAEQIVMPLSPRTLVAVSPSPAVGVVPDAFVRKLNACQIHAASDYVYTHPASGLEDFVRSERFGTPCTD